MMRLFLFLIFAAPAAFSQQAQTEYVVLENKQESFFMELKTPKLKVDKNIVFTDSDRAILRYNNYFSRPIDLRERFQDCRYAYEPTAYDVVTNNVMHSIFPEVKW